MKISETSKETGVICLLQYEKSFLLLKRNKEPNIYLFVPPSGKVGANETPIEAITRKTQEEFGVTVNDWKLCGTLEEKTPKSNKLTSVFIAKVDHFAPSSCEDGKLEWMLFENITNIPTPTTDWYIYKYVFKNQKFAFNAIFDENMKLLKIEDELESKLVYGK